MDVHKEAIVIALLDGSGKLVMETIVETKASSILQFLHGLRGELHVTWEEGTWAAWLYDLLQPQVQEAVVCNPRRNALLKEGSKSDKVHARKLADLLRSGFPRKGSICVVSRNSEPRRPLVGVAALETVEVLEPHAGGPLVERTRRARLIDRRVVILAEPRRFVAVLEEDAANRGAIPADHAVVTGEARRDLGDHTEPDRVMVAPGDQRGPVASTARSSGSWCSAARC